MQVLRAILRWCVLPFNLLAVAALLLCALVPYVVPASWSTLSILAIGAEWIVLINLLFMIGWLFTNHKAWSILSCMAIVLSLGIVSSMVSHGIADTDDNYPHRLTVMSYNTHRMGNFKKHDENDVLRYIHEQDADIICLQEVEVYKDSHFLTLWELKKYMDRHPYTYIDFITYNSHRQFGNVVFSKYPLINKETIRYESSTNISNHCDIIVDGDTVRLISNHLESNRFDNSAISSTDSMLNHAEQLSRRIGSTAKRRALQAQAVHEVVKASPYPVIVAGDFNDVPGSYTYRKIADGLQDCFLSSSWCRLGHTFVKHGVGIRIDYILCDKKMRTQSFVIDHVPHSDHFPITATIAW